MIEDWEINCRVRAYLVKWWIDITKLDIRTIGGVVYIKGAVRFKEKAKLGEGDKPATLLRIERDLHKIEGVKDVILQFSNWAKYEDEWVETKETV